VVKANILLLVPDALKKICSIVGSLIHSHIQSCLQSAPSEYSVLGTKMAWPLVFPNINKPPLPLHLPPFATDDVSTDSISGSGLSNARGVTMNFSWCCTSCSTR